MGSLPRASKSSMMALGSAPRTLQNGASKPNVHYDLEHVQGQFHSNWGGSDKAASKERKSVSFNLDACTVHEITPYSEIYAAHPDEQVPRDTESNLIPFIDEIALSDENCHSGIG